MATWNSRGLRGSGLEDLINLTISVYRESGLALIQKIPTPIKPIKIDKDSKHITLAYFDQKSTVDYIGVAQGIPICFDAKECKTDTFPLANVHEHQILFMKDFEKQGGIAFFIVYYTERDECYYLPLRDMLNFFERANEGGVKRFYYDEIDKTFLIKGSGSTPVHFLEQINLDIISRDKK
mgnify:CR=1 FL=1